MFLESSGFLISQLLSPTAKVRRTDGTRVPGTDKQSWKQEFTALWKHLRSPRVSCIVEIWMNRY
jgi:hypothetical protein